MDLSTELPVYVELCSSIDESYFFPDGNLISL
jgi:hypothetical protein